MTRHYRAQILIAVLTGLAFSSCVHTPVSTRPGSFATSYPTKLIVDQLLFGRNIPTGGTVSDSAWYLFLNEVVTPRFPDGFGTLRSEGQWRYADGHVGREDGFVLELTYLPGMVADSAVEAIAREYMRRFNQEAVSRHTWPVQHSMYWSGPLRAQPPSDARLVRTKAAVDLIRADDIVRDVSYLASDANMGRRTPFPGLASPGYDSAAAYVARFLAAMHVTPMGDNGTYFQHYTVTRSTLDTTKVAGAIGNAPLAWGSDFLVQSFLLPGVREANVIYVGTGIRRPKLNVDPYAGFDIKGKWLLVSGSPVPAGRGAPRPDPSLGKIGIDYTTINEVARFGGALGIITVATDSARALWTRREVTGQDLNPSVGVAYAQYQVPRISISTSALARLLAGTSLSPETVLSTDSTISRRSVDLGASRRVRIDFAATTVEARPYNVVGMLEGSDPVLKNEWISLAAHLDGAVPANASVPGNGLADQYNAADDNASGSAGNMAVVRALVAAPRTKRSILLIWDSGEEVGLWGTRTIAYGPWSEKLVLHVSNDMIGRSRRNNSPRVQTLSSADTIYVTGPNLLSTRIEGVLQRASTEFPFIALDRRYEDVSASYYYPRTDAGPYLERGIPIMQFFNGEHPDYHKPSDDVGKLDMQKITNVSKLSFGALWLAADDAGKLSWDGIVPETLWWVRPRR